MICRFITFMVERRIIIAWVVRLEQKVEMEYQMKIGLLRLVETDLNLLLTLKIQILFMHSINMETCIDMIKHLAKELI